MTETTSDESEDFRNQVTAVAAALFAAAADDALGRAVFVDARRARRSGECEENATISGSSAGSGKATMAVPPAEARAFPFVVDGADAAPAARRVEYPVRREETLKRDA